MKITLKRSVVLFLCQILIQGFVYSQPQKGQVLLGCAAEIRNLVPQESGNPMPNVAVRKEKYYKAGIQAGYFLTDRVAVGLLCQADHQENQYVLTGNPIFESSEGEFFSAGVFARYYLGTGHSRVFFFGHLAGVYGEGKYSSAKSMNFATYSTIFTFNTVEYRYSAFLMPGVTYFVTRSFALEATVGAIGYSHSKSNTTSNSVSPVPPRDPAQYSQFDFSINQFVFGFHFYLGNKTAVEKVD